MRGCRSHVGVVRRGLGQPLRRLGKPLSPRVIAIRQRAANEQNSRLRVRCAALSEQDAPEVFFQITDIYARV